MQYRYSKSKRVELFANSCDPDQMLHSAASDLGLHCLPITLLGVSRLQWVKQGFIYSFKQVIFHLKSLSQSLDKHIKK